MKPLRFRVVALIAAYALALHVQLLAFAAVAPLETASHLAGLCAAPASDTNKAPPGSHDTACAMACAMLGGGMAAPPQSVVARVAPVLALVLDPAVDRVPPRPPIEGLPRARAPPRA